MKNKLLICVIIFLFSAKANAQMQLSFSLIPSVSASSYRGLNYVIDRYNSTRQGQSGAATLSRQMSNLKVMAGLGWRLGLYIEIEDNSDFFFAISRTGRRAHTFAEGRDVTGSAIRRDLRFTANSLNLEGGLSFGSSSEGAIISGGGSLDLITHKVYTRLNNVAYKTVMDEFNVGVSLFVQGDIFVTDYFSIGLRPSYQYIPLTTSYGDLNSAINPATANADAKEDMSSSGSNFSLLLMLNLVLGGE